MTHICAGNLTITGSDNGRHQAIIRTNAGMLLIGPLGTNFSEILIDTDIFLSRCIWKCRQENGDLNVLNVLIKMVRYNKVLLNRC